MIRQIKHRAINITTNSYPQTKPLKNNCQPAKTLLVQKSNHLQIVAPKY